MFFRCFDKFQICILTFLKGVERDRADHKQNRQKQQTHDCVLYFRWSVRALGIPERTQAKKGRLSSTLEWGRIHTDILIHTHMSIWVSTPVVFLLIKICIPIERYWLSIRRYWYYQLTVSTHHWTVSATASPGVAHYAHKFYTLS